MNELTSPSEDEILEIERRVSERKKKAPNVSVEMVDDVVRLTIGENREAGDRLRLMAALGTYDMDFLNPLLSQIGNSVSAEGEVQEGAL